MIRGFEIVRQDCRKFPELEIKLPTRADVGSVGYDFYSPIDFTIMPGETKIVSMDVKAYMLPDEVLCLWIRSSMGIKKRIVLSNQTGVVDSSYYGNPDNDGNICAALTNMGVLPYSVSAGDKIMQGVFMKYLVSDDDKPLSQIRTGGIGSTGN